MDSTKVEMSRDDLYKVFGKAFEDLAKVSVTEEARLNMVKKLCTLAILSLTAILISVIIGITVVLTSLTVVIENGADSKYGEVTLYDESKIDSDNTTSNINTDTYNNYINTEGVDE